MKRLKTKQIDENQAFLDLLDYLEGVAREAGADGARLDEALGQVRALLPAEGPGRHRLVPAS